MSKDKNALGRLKIAEFIVENGSYDGEHHKQWVLDQVLRQLLGDNYKGFIKDFMYECETIWEKGVAP